MVISIPHSGVLFPKDLEADFRPEIVKHPEDTDWFVYELYDFAASLGVRVIKAELSRYVVDLNRDPAFKKLYSDGRPETQVVPMTTFLGNPLYVDKLPSDVDKKDRIQKYFLPYHDEIRKSLNSKNLKNVVLLDAHSIKQQVLSIRPTPFADLILGSGDGKTAHPTLIRETETLLKNSGYSFSSNDPFKGGFITRSFANPNGGIHTLQLEMSQTVYMDDRQQKIDSARLKKIRATLKSMVSRIIETTGRLN